MMIDSCRQWRPALGAWVLGALEGAEADELVKHLTDCEGCRTEAAELTGVAAALGMADPSRVDTTPPQPPPGLGDRVSARIAEERARRVRRRTRSLLAAAAVVLAAAVATVAWWPAPDEPDTFAVAVTEATGGLDASVNLQDRGWGAYVEIEASGLEGGAVYRVWVEDQAGERHSAGSFIGVADERITCYMAASTRVDEVALFGIDRADGTPALRGELPSGVRTSSR